jgi:ubiquinone/menaquinone biosynthesis C-methylase UbiE
MDILTPNIKIRNFIEADAQHLPLKTDSLTRIYASQLLEHLPDPHKFLDECNRCLQRRGILYLWVPNMFTLNAKKDPTHHYSYNFLTLRRILRQHNFNRLYWRYLVLTSYIPRKIRKFLNAIHSVFLEELYVEAQ